MIYKGYTGVVELDEETGTIHGKVAGLRDVITFQGDTAPEAIRAFRDSVDDYLAFCAELGRPPETPAPGEYLLKIDPALHRTLAAQAEARRMSPDALASEALAAFAATVREGA